MSSDEEYIIRESLKNEISIILTLMDDYVSEETIIQSFIKENVNKFSEEDKKLLMKLVSDYFLNIVHNYPSLVAIHVPSQKIVGHLVLVTIENPLLAKESSQSSISLSPPEGSPDDVNIFLENVDKFVAMKETFERHPGVEKLIRMSALGVNKEHRRKGLSKRLLQRGVDWSTEKGYKLTQGTFSSALSKRTGLNLGFRSLADFDLRNYRNKQGDPIFADAGVNNVISTMTLELRN